MKLVHLNPDSFSQLVSSQVIVVTGTLEIARNEIVLFTGPEDYPDFPFRVIIAARFRAWAPLRPRKGGAPAAAMLFNAWWILNRPFLMQDVAVSGRRYHAGSMIVDVHEADEVVIRQRRFEETGPLQNPGPREPALRTVDERRIADLFHRLWGRDKSHPEYDKQQWNELQALLRARGVKF